MAGNPLPWFAGNAAAGDILMEEKKMMMQRDDKSSVVWTFQHFDGGKENDDATVKRRI